MKSWLHIRLLKLCLMRLKPRKQLRELGLTLQTLASGEADEVTELIDEVNKADDYE